MSDPVAERVLVTGASSGIGLATALARYGRRGARVGLIARGADGLERAATMVAAAGREAPCRPRRCHRSEGPRGGGRGRARWPRRRRRRRSRRRRCITDVSSETPAEDFVADRHHHAGRRRQLQPRRSPGARGERRVAGHRRLDRVADAAATVRRLRNRQARPSRIRRLPPDRALRAGIVGIGIARQLGPVDTPSGRTLRAGRAPCPRRFREPTCPRTSPPRSSPVARSGRRATTVGWGVGRHAGLFGRSPRRSPNGCYARARLLLTQPSPDRRRRPAVRRADR